MEHHGQSVQVVLRRVSTETGKPHPPFPAATNFCMRRRVPDIINHAKFEVNRFKGFGSRKSPFSIDLRYRPYNSVRTNVLHCDSFQMYFTMRCIISLSSVMLCFNIYDIAMCACICTVCRSELTDLWTSGRGQLKLALLHTTQI